ncbi:putative acetyltransferase [Bhargavaea cecembensis DSE10]|uniref:Putative acetyltransferase n=1 Tax=Bhargavaea cecembensis DSE10 TaxID=1235279 RepID=M7NJ59_9BACL|nr:GNAT family N-acetyltransferase [Bhargavaea cecembensis]EMR07252.1 putative acetyltransferase [Bhargavaea cecembensis DSE10]
MKMQTARCVLEPPAAGDLDAVKLLYGSEPVRAFLGGTRTGAEVERAFAGMLQNADSCWIIRQLEDGAFIGSVSLDLHHDGEALEISYQLLPEFWGRGYGTEAATEVIRHAFSNLGQERLLAETQAANTASRRLLERLGMKEERRVERFGEEQVIYSLSRERFMTGSLSVSPFGL